MDGVEDVLDGVLEDLRVLNLCLLLNAQEHPELWKKYK